MSHASASSRVAAALKYDACGWWMMIAAVSSTLRPRVLRRVRGRVRLRDGTRRDQPVYDLRGARNPPLRARALGSVFVHPAIDFDYPLAYRSMDGRILQFAAIAGAVVLAIAVVVGTPRIRGRDFAYIAMAGTVELIDVFLANVPEVVAAFRSAFAGRATIVVVFVVAAAALGSDYATPTPSRDRTTRSRSSRPMPFRVSNATTAAVRESCRSKSATRFYAERGRADRPANGSRTSVRTCRCEA